MLDCIGIEYTTEPTLDADVFHTNLLGPRSVYYARRATDRDVPVVVNTHVTAEDFGESFRFTNKLARPLRLYLEWGYGLADALVCPSAYNQRIIGSYTELPTTVISNGVDHEKLAGFESLETTYRDRYDLTEPTVFAVGHVIKRKGLKTFVQTASRMSGMDFVWFGPLDLFLKGKETTKIINNAPVNCTFTGYIEDIRGAYAAGDIFYFPTNEENEGIALLEAMATGKPVLIRDIEPFQWLNDGEECIKVEANEGVNAFVEALNRLTDPLLRDQIGSKAAARSEAFSLESLADQYRSLYKEVI